MIEDAQEILDYLPYSYKSENDQRYVNFLWETFQHNYEGEKYQFAYLAYHMLFMSFVYFRIWHIKSYRLIDFKNALVGTSKNIEKELLDATSPFTFSSVPETSILRFFKLLDYDNDHIGRYTKLVKDRNDIAHSNGNIFFNDLESVDDKIREYLQCAEHINELSKSIILNCFEHFLKDSQDPEEREFVDATEQLYEILIHKNYLSPKDISICLDFDISTLEGEAHYDEICGLYTTLRNEFE